MDRSAHQHATGFAHGLDAVAGALPVLPVLLRLRPHEPWPSPAFPGSTFRGAFGHALKLLACRCEAGGEERGDHELGCAYAEVFEPPGPEGGAPIRGPRDPSPRFVLAWDTSVPWGTTLAAPYALRLTLFGAAAGRADAVIAAFDHAARDGFGRLNVRQEFLAAAMLPPAIGENDRGQPGPWPLDAWLPVSENEHARANGETSNRACTIALLTPLQLKEDGRPARRIGPVLFVRAALRRLDLLGAPVADREPWLAAAARLRVTHDRTR